MYQVTASSGLFNWFMGRNGYDELPTNVPPVADGEGEGVGEASGGCGKLKNTVKGRGGGLGKLLPASICRHISLEVHVILLLYVSLSLYNVNNYILM